MDCNAVSVNLMLPNILVTPSIYLLNSFLCTFLLFFLYLINHTYCGPIVHTPTLQAYSIRRSAHLNCLLVFIEIAYMYILTHHNQLHNIDKPTSFSIFLPTADGCVPTVLISRENFTPKPQISLTRTYARVHIRHDPCFIYIFVILWAKKFREKQIQNYVYDM